MPEYGVTATGFNRKRLEDVLEELEADVRAKFSAYGEAVNVAEDSLLGILLGIMAERIATLWELAEAVYNSQYPDTASGVPLDNVASVTGISRNAATYSSVALVLYGDTGTLVPSGSMVSMENDPSVVFVTQADKTIGVLGYEVVLARAYSPGPVAAPAFTLTVIETPVGGWNQVTNPLDADLGSDEESDTELRLRRKDSLRVAGSAAVDAIAAQLKDLKGVDDALVFENATNSTDPDGRPPHSFEAIVDAAVIPEPDPDELSQLIADTIWEHKPAGIETYGDWTVTVQDAQGRTHDVKFSQPAGMKVFVEVDYTLHNEETFPNDGEEQIAQKIVEYGSTLAIGEDVILSRLIGPVHEVEGIGSVVIRASMVGELSADPPSPYGTTNISVGPKEQTKFDTSRVTVTQV